MYKYKYFVFLIIIFSTLSLAENTSVAVIDLKNAGGVPEHFSMLLSEALRAEMFKYDKFDVRNREDVKSVLEEQAFQQSGACDDNACYVQVGKVLGVEKIVTGSIGKLGNTYSLTIKQIDIETSANDKIISNRKQCSEDDLFIMIENAVKELIIIENNKLTEPGEFKEIKEIQAQRSTPADGFDERNSDDVKEWEMLGMTRKEYVDYKRTGLNIEEFKIVKNNGYNFDNLSKHLALKEKYDIEFDEFTQLLLCDFDFSKIGDYQNDKDENNKTIQLNFLYPGLGSLYSGSIVRGTTFILLQTSCIIFFYIKNEEEHNALLRTLVGSAATHIIFSFTDNGIVDYKYNGMWDSKYKLTLSPMYNPQNNGVGVGFSVNF